MRTTLSRAWCGIAALSLGLSACDRDAVVSGPGSEPISSFVTGAAAAALQSNGEFAKDAPESPDGTTLISDKRAGELALAYVRSYGRSFHDAWEQQRGAPIDLSTLTVNPRIYFAHTPYGPFPRGFHPALRRSYGPYYLVTLEAGGVPAIEMAVSAFNTDVSIGTDGLIHLPRLNGMGFIHSGIPTVAATYAPVSPEDAARRAFVATHARVSTPPQLVLLGHDKSPLLAAWQISLEQDVPAHARGEAVAMTTHRVLVGPRQKDRFALGDDPQPATEQDAGPAVDADGNITGVQPFVVPVRPGRVVRTKTIDFGQE